MYVLSQSYGSKVFLLTNKVNTELKLFVFPIKI